jgi:hypothetical protein
MSTPEEINEDSQYAWPGDNEALYIAGSENRFTMMFVTYIKGRGMNVRGVIVPGSSMEQYMYDMQNMDVCDCHPGMGWSMDAYDPETGRYVRTQTLDTHVALAWMRKPADILDLDLDGLDACEELTFVPEGEHLQTVFNDFNGYVSGGLTMHDAHIDEDVWAQFFNTETEES